MENIRLARQEDLDEVMAFVGEVIKQMNAQGNFQWKSDYPTRQHFSEDVEHKSLYVFTIDERVVGVVAHTLDFCEEYGQVCDNSIPSIVSHRLAVNPQFQGRGIAKKLIAYADQLCPEKHVNCIRGDTNIQNIPMQRVFEQLGYKNMGNISLALRPGLTFVCYEKVVNSQE